MKPSAKDRYAILQGVLTRLHFHRTLTLKSAAEQEILKKIDAFIEAGGTKDEKDLSAAFEHLKELP